MSQEYSVHTTRNVPIWERDYYISPPRQKTLNNKTFRPTPYFFYTLNNKVQCFLTLMLETNSSKRSQNLSNPALVVNKA